MGGTSSSMSLSGSIAAVNAFIANNRVTYTTAANASADATLTILVNTGSVSNDTQTITLSVIPVNDAPVVSVPVSITVIEDLGSPLTGISFSDVDAGSGLVSATFSVPSGTLSAVSGSGVTVQDSGTATLTLSGTLSDINAFIAAASVKFQTARDNTSSVLLTVSINDHGNTGGSAQSDSKTVIINVTAVNDAPVNAVPGDQSVKQGAVLTFSSANGNLVSISDVDAGSGSLVVTLTSTNGLISLSSTAGLAFHNGNVPGSLVLEFEGTLAQINAALNGMTFTPTPGYNGAASFTITSNDQGSSGSGGAQSDTDAINITVQPLNPSVTNVSVLQGDGAYKLGDLITVVVTFDQAVNVAGGVPSLLLETGLVDRLATYAGGSGSSVLTFTYRVQAGDVSADLDYQSSAALQLNGATIRSVGSEDAVLTLPGIGSADSIAGQKDIVIDGVVPKVGSVNVPADGTYVAGQHLDFTVNLNEAVLVGTANGVPRLAVTLGDGSVVYADYLSGSGSTALVFRLTVGSGRSGALSVGSSLDLNGGTLRDAHGNDARTQLSNVDSTAGIVVDAKPPRPTGIVLDGPVAPGATSLSFTLSFDEAVSGVDVGDFSLIATGGASGKLLSVVRIDAQTYRINVGAVTGEGSLSLGLNAQGSGISDKAGNALAISLMGPAQSVGTPGVRTQDAGDPEFRISAPAARAEQASPLIPPQVSARRWMPASRRCPWRRCSKPVRWVAVLRRWVRFS
ncbi:hypothetical protein G3436_23445 [Pseudomonas sp. MAFF212427]|uniref:RapA2 cadherin-like domain-containing protein n=1 Tax=Pseudomonas brassicae TaxID=2708063 RepID=A0A6B3NWL4_9PSED|nr:hypothetical protein [Pseudomonas brassicae]